MAVPPDLRLLRLLQLASPTLPVGAYAYSGGLEHAVSAGWVTDEDSAREWIRGVMMRGLSTLDVPVLRRLHAAWSSEREDEACQWSAFLLACRESAELRAEDQHLGTAMARLLADLGIETARPWAGHAHCTWAAMFSLAAYCWRIEAEAMQQAYLWSWCENQVAAAIKLVPLGQTAGQRILHACSEAIVVGIRHAATLTDDDLGHGLPGLALGSALHETQYSRLFRS